MITPRRILPVLIVILAAASLLAACGGGPLIGSGPGQVATLPAAAPSVTPGGRLVMLMPTSAPPTPTTDAVAPPVAGTPAYLLTAFPAGGVVCPDPGNPAPPDLPATYGQFATTINRFLTAGGSVPFLDAILGSWQVIGDDLGLVTDAYDLTGDGVYEVIVILADPFNAEVSPRPGQMFIYGCGQGDYRLLYASDYGPGFGLPRLLYVGDMNADFQQDMVFFQERCQNNACVQAAQVLTWSAPNDGFLALNVDTVGASDGRFSIQDLDGDGIQEIMIQGGGLSSDISVGPARSSTTIWDWNGHNYVRALSRQDPPVYRIHVIHDADQAIREGDGQTAVQLYEQALNDAQLGSWQVPNEPLMLRAYALYRLMIAYAYLEDDRAGLDIHSTLLAEDSDPALPSYAYAMVGDAFWRTYQSTHNLHTACVAALEQVPAYPQAVLFLNSYGAANRSYQVPDLCPF